MGWFGFGAYRSQGGLRPALALDQETLVDLAGAAEALGFDWHEPAGSLFENWDTVGAELLRLGEQAAERAAELRGLENVIGSIAPPFRPSRIFGAASNFIEHADEMGTVLAAKVDSNPFMFVKVSTTVVGPGEDVVLPPQSEQVDWEVELAAVIGRTARNVSVAEALGCVAGYTVVNDVSARDLNMRTDFPFKFDWFQGKNFDTFAPLGPWIVPASLVPDPQAVQLRLSVNGEVMQDASTDQMIFSVAEQIAYLSSILTLAPGDVIATGTPDGVGMGRGVFLKPGDLMRAEADGIGVLESPVVAL